MSRILIIGAGWEQVELIKRIKDEGHFIIATHPFMSVDGLNLADSFYIKDSRDIKGHITIAETHKIDAVITDNCDYSFFTAAVVASKFKLPFADIQSAIYSNDKYAQRLACRKQNLQQPVFFEARTLNDVKAAIDQIGFPAIIKPVDSRGTFGVTILNDQCNVENAFFDAMDNSPSRRLICEQFILGTLVTVDGFCFKNGHRALTVASRKFEMGPKPVTKEIIYPAEFPAEIREQLLKNHESVVKGLGYTYGHSHGEYILTDTNDIFLVECTNRGGGVYTSSVILPLLTEIDINLSLLNQSMGIDTLEIEAGQVNFMKKSVILTFLDFEVGSVIKSINLAEMLNEPYTVRFRSIYSQNDMVESIENCASRHSMLVLKGASVESAKKNLVKFKESLNIEYYSSYDKLD